MNESKKDNLYQDYINSVKLYVNNNSKNDEEHLEYEDEDQNNMIPIQGFYEEIKFKQEEEISSDDNVSEIDDYHKVSLD